MSLPPYKSMNSRFEVNRRDFLLATSVIGAGLALGSPVAWAQDKAESSEPQKPATNVADVLNVPRTRFSIPGAFPGRTVEVHSLKSMKDGQPVAAAVNDMFVAGIEKLTGKSGKEAYGLFFEPEDVIGIKINPVGGLMNTRMEVVDAIIAWLEASGHTRKNIIIWDRFDYMLPDTGYTPERFPGIGLEGLQTMDESAAMGETDDDSRWLDEKGNHRSVGNFDMNTFYWADVDGPKDKPYLNQHVFNGKESYFGKLVTQKLTKIINVPVFKNTGNGVSMATKNLGYGAICNTGRLHRPLFFDVCTEVMAFPCLRDKVVLNINDGLRGQYDGGPMPAAAFTYDHHKLYFATDPFALDMACHKEMVQIRKDKDVDVNEHPIFTEYLHYAERLGLGVVDETKTEHIVEELG